jgi:hypothetical protein
VALTYGSEGTRVTYSACASLDRCCHRLDTRTTLGTRHTRCVAVGYERCHRGCAAQRDLLWGAGGSPTFQELYGRSGMDSWDGDDHTELLSDSASFSFFPPKISATFTIRHQQALNRSESKDSQIDFLFSFPPAPALILLALTLPNTLLEGLGGSSSTNPTRLLDRGGPWPSGLSITSS